MHAHHIMALSLPCARMRNRVKRLVVSVYNIYGIHVCMWSKVTAISHLSAQKNFTKFGLLMCPCIYMPPNLSVILLVSHRSNAILFIRNHTVSSCAGSWILFMRTHAYGQPILVRFNAQWIHRTDSLNSSCIIIHVNRQRTHPVTPYMISDKINNWLWAFYIKTSWIVFALQWVSSCNMGTLKYSYLFVVLLCSFLLLAVNGHPIGPNQRQHALSLFVVDCARQMYIFNVPIYCLSACNVQASNPTARMLWFSNKNLLLMEILKRSWISTRKQSMLKGACIDAVAHADSVTLWAGAFLSVLAGATGALEVAIYEPGCMKWWIYLFFFVHAAGTIHAWTPLILHGTCDPRDNIYGLPI